MSVLTGEMASGRLRPVRVADDGSLWITSDVTEPVPTRDGNGQLAVVLVANYGADVTKNAKALAGTVTALTATNRNASLRYFQLHRTATVPGAATVPYRSWPVPGNSVLMLGACDFGGGLVMTTGIAYAWSTTEGTFTAATAADHSTEIMGF